MADQVKAVSDSVDFVSSCSMSYVSQFQRQQLPTLASQRQACGRVLS